jgi:hypothetical protein
MSIQRNTIIGRNAIKACCALCLLLFFFPLLTIHVPIAGEQDVSGYDMFSKLVEAYETLSPSEAVDKVRDTVATRQMPLSIQLGFLMPLALIIGFASAAVALITAFKAIHVSRIVCVIGAACASAAILHIMIMNSDIHSWLAASTQSELKNNPFAGIGTLMLNAFQMKPGWGLYAMLVLLGVGAVFGFRLGSRGEDTYAAKEGMQEGTQDAYESRPASLLGLD